MAEFQIVIAPFVLYLMSSVVTAGVTWQAFSSANNKEELKHICMLPVWNWKLSLSYVVAVGCYAIVTISGFLLSVVFAVSKCSGIEILTSIICVLNAVLMSACIYVYRKYRWIGIVWAGLLLLVMYIGNQWASFLWIIVANSVGAVVWLLVANPYSFIQDTSEKHNVCHGGNHYSVWQYIFRYLISHKNYMTNTFAMWGGWVFCYPCF